MNWKALRSAARAAALAAVLAVPTSASADCSIDRIELRGEWGNAAFTIEIADTPDERARGLQQRRTLPQSAGMLFLFDRPGPVSFWMKDTLLPLDMLFVSEAGIVTRIHQDAVPLDLSPISSNDKVFAVLEINGGISERFGLTTGTQIRHPAFDLDIAAWPCKINN